MRPIYRETLLGLALAVPIVALVAWFDPLGMRPKKKPCPAPIAATWKAEDTTVRTQKIILVDADGKQHLKLWVDGTAKMEIDTGNGRRIVDLGALARKIGERPE